MYTKKLFGGVVRLQTGSIYVILFGLNLETLFEFTVILKHDNCNDSVLLLAC